jgi:hypothetical protein
MVAATPSRIDPSAPHAQIALPAAEPVDLRNGSAVWLHAIAPDSVRDERGELAAMDADGRTVGWIAYRRVYGPRAELTLEVDDALWHAGLPEALLGSAGRRADAGGIATFLVSVARSDGRLLLLLSDGVVRASPTRTGWLDVELRVLRARRLRRAIPGAGPVTAR